MWISAIERKDIFRRSIRNNKVEGKVTGISITSGYLVTEGRYNDAAFDVEIQGLQKGIYVLRISSGGKSKVWKIIKA